MERVGRGYLRASIDEFGGGKSPLAAISLVFQNVLPSRMLASLIWPESRR